MVFPSWPWTNFHEDNQSWLIKTVKECKEIVEEALADVSDAVATYFADHIDTTLTQSGKAAQAKAAGDAIRANAAGIADLDTTVQGININVSNLTTRVARNENSINNLLTADTNLDHRITYLNSRYEGTVQDVKTLTSRVSHTETQISHLGDADEALGDRITALEGTVNVNAVKDYVFNIYEYDGANDPMYICTMEDSPNGINSLLSDLNGRIPVNVKAIINYSGMVSSRVANLTTVRVGNEIHGVEFDAGDFHCRFLDSNTMGTAYFRDVIITLTSSDTGVYTKGDFQSIAHYPANVVIVISGTSYKVVNIGPGQQSDELELSFLKLENSTLTLRHVFVDPKGTIQFA